MVDCDAFKSKIIEILNKDIEFLGDNFCIICKQINDKKEKEIYNWLEKIKLKLIRPIIPTKNKRYKQWKTYEILVFRYAFSIEKTEYRIILVKLKNSFYIEFHLSNHYYYEKLRKELFLKENEVLLQT